MSERVAKKLRSLELAFDGEPARAIEHPSCLKRLASNAWRSPTYNPEQRCVTTKHKVEGGETERGKIYEKTGGGGQEGEWRKR